MASGKKNYFRHSTTAFEDSKIQRAIELLGYEGYAYYFILLELFAKQCENEMKNPIKIHQQTLRIVWRKSQQSCHKVVTKLQQSGLFVFTLSESLYEFDVPNLAKYLGKYDSKFEPNAPNKRKENESKIKEIKTNTKKPKTIAPASPDAIAILESMNLILDSKYQVNNFNLKFINARLDQNYTRNDFDLVARSKLGEWGKNDDMRRFLRPETLFGNKFEAYLEVARNPVKSRDERLLEFFKSQGVEGYTKEDLFPKQESK